MGLLYAPFFLAIISGVMSEPTLVIGVQGGDVLLPCPCVGRDLNKELKWQTENKRFIYKSKPHEEIYGENYTTRVETFWNENSNDCTIHLKTITEDDNDTYGCIFYKAGVYTSQLINLEVKPSPTSVSLGNPESLKDNPEPPKPSREKFIIIPVVAFLLVMVTLGIFISNKEGTANY
ncbi:uncharacterized protein FYW61_009797 [Anableps anableps]